MSSIEDFRARARLRLLEIFNTNKWDIENYPTDLFKNAYNKFCQAFDILDEEEIKLILTLTSSYKCYNFGNYFALLGASLNTLNVDFLKTFESIFITQAISQEDITRGKIKSSSQLLYCTQEMLSQKISRERKVVACDTIDSIESRYRDRKDSLIIMVDDYIGSSETTIKSLQYYFEKYMHPDDSVVILALVAQKDGINCLVELGIDAYCGEILYKGIEDNSEIKNKSLAYCIMNSIESRLKINDDYLRGYYSSEGLVSMVRTPNNTFPIYWCSRGKFGKDWPAPFERA